jgi:hypothetical protein
MLTLQERFTASAGSLPSRPGRVHEFPCDPPLASLPSRAARQSPRLSHPYLLPALASVIVLLALMPAAAAQVGPSEITNPQLKALEAAYLQQLISMREAINRVRFPFELLVSRYVGLDPKQQAGSDARGLEFVLFHERTILKTSANYNATFDSILLTKNQRACRVFSEVVVPILRLIPDYFTPEAGFDRFGFEISYHVRTHTRSYDYEGKEILAVVLDKADAFGYPGAQTDGQRQSILNASEIYLNGREFGLALNSPQPYSAPEVMSLRQVRAGREGSSPPVSRSGPVPAVSTPPVRLIGNADQGAGSGKPAPPVAAAAVSAGSPSGRSGAAAESAEAAALQSSAQAQLDTLVKEGSTRYHFVDYAPPSFVTFRSRIYLQLTLRNPKPFDRNTTSIYRRAAQSFDLFLAPLLESLLERTPVAEVVAGLDITVLNEFGVDAGESPEALELIFPLEPLRKFTAAEITNQDLINQSIVLVNGVRIALNLQQVE